MFVQLIFLPLLQFPPVSSFNGVTHMFQIQMEVAVWFVQDQLKGDNVTEIRVKFVRRLEDAVPAGED